jgi:hypothetical protein
MKRPVRRKGAFAPFFRREKIFIFFWYPGRGPRTTCRSILQKDDERMLIRVRFAEARMLIICK